MSYNKKIELLETRIREMDKNRIKIETAFNESFNAIGKILKVTEKSDTREGLKMVKPFVEDALSNSLELFRINSDIIKTISPNVATILEAEIEKFQKLCSEGIRSFSSLVEENKATEKTSSQYLREIKADLNKILELIEISRGSIKGTLEKMKN